jgi:aminoglycoside N3'-acetyltransferase
MIEVRGGLFRLVRLMMTATKHTDSRISPVPVWLSPAGCRFDADLAQRRMRVWRRMLRREHAGRASELAKRLAAWLTRDGLQDVEVLTNPGSGELLGVSGRLCGGTGQELLITTPMGTAEAVDGAAGVGVALGIGCLLAAAGRGGWRPERGVRLLFIADTRGLQELQQQHARLFKRAVLELNLHLTGAHRADCGTALTIVPSPPAWPDPFLPLLLRGLDAMPWVRWSLGQDYPGSALACSLSGVPVTWVRLASASSVPVRQERVAGRSNEILRSIGEWLGSHVGCLCAAGPAEVSEMARFGLRYARGRLAEVARTVAARRLGSGEAAAVLRHHVAQERRRLSGLLRLIPADEQPLLVDSTLPVLPPVDARGLFAAVAVRALVQRLAERIVPPAVRGPAPVVMPAEGRVRRDGRRVPLMVRQGFLDTETLDPEVRRQLCRVAGTGLDRDAPGWLQWALGWSSGKRTLEEIGALVYHEGCGVPAPRLVRTLDFLARQGLVRWRPRLTERELDRALRRVGVRPGMLVMAHSSLSAFGYIEGGARTVIDRLQAAVGGEGTLAMPTHTVSTFGQPAYDAARTPSTVGAITDLFRRLDGVRRSPHPTHSVAARGPLAEALTAGHTGALAPLAREGFWGRFVDHDGWVLLMAPLRKNTLMHAAELWSGVKLPGMVLAGRPGRRRAGRVVPAGPWHSNWFDLAHERMRCQGQIATVSLGEGTLYLMRGRDVVEAGLAVLRADPLQVTKKNCRCKWCEIVRRRNGTGGGGPGFSIGPAGIDARP